MEERAQLKEPSRAVLTLAHSQVTALQEPLLLLTMGRDADICTDQVPATFCNTVSTQGPSKCLAQRSHMGAHVITRLLLRRVPFLQGSSRFAPVMQATTSMAITHLKTSLVAVYENSNSKFRKCPLKIRYS